MSYTHLPMNNVDDESIIEIPRPRVPATSLVNFLRQFLERQANRQEGRRNTPRVLVFTLRFRTALFTTWSIVTSPRYAVRRC
jgi:hypothetical protein